MERLAEVRDVFKEVDDPLPLLQGMFAFAPFGALLLRRDGSVLAANRVFRSILGEPSAGPTYRESDVADAMGLSDEIRRAFAGEVIDLEPRWRTLHEHALDEGSATRRRALTGNVFPLPDPKGIRYVVLVLADVTAEMSAREEVEARRREAERERARLDALVQQMRGGVIMADAPTGNIVLANAQVEEILGHPLLESPAVEDYARWGAIHLDGRPYTPEEHPLARALDQGEVIDDEEVWYRRPDGDVRVLSVSAAPVRDAADRVQAAFATFIDITARKRYEQSRRILAEAGAALVSSLDVQQLLQAVVEVAIPELADYCAAFIPRRGQLERVAFARDTLATATSRLAPAAPPRDTDGTNPADPLRMVMETRRDQRLPASEPVLQAVARDTEHHRLLRSLELTEVLLVPINGRSETLGVLGIAASRISGRALDQVLLDTAHELAALTGLALENAHHHHEAQRAIKAREETLAIVSHDLRTPLSVVLLGSRLLLERVTRDRFLERNLLNIQQAALRMRHLIDDLLDLARLDTGKLELHKQPHPVADVLEEVCSLLQPVAEDRGRLLELRLHPTLTRGDVRLSVDRERLLQVLTNLIDNAIKFSPQNGQVTVGAEPAQSGKGIEFSVHDRGPGVPRHEHLAIFERFWTGAGKGDASTGLGLAIVKAVTEAHGGRVWVDPNTEQGSTFRLFIPFSPEDLRSPPSPRAPRAL